MHNPWGVALFSKRCTTPGVVHLLYIVDLEQGFEEIDDAIPPRNFNLLGFS